jgi:hypothetical protein
MRAMFLRFLEILKNGTWPKDSDQFYEAVEAISLKWFDIQEMAQESAQKKQA